MQSNNKNAQQSAELIRQIRSLSGLTLRKLARRAKTSAPALTDYEVGRHEAKLSTIQRLADAAGYELVIEVRQKLS